MLKDEVSVLEICAGKKFSSAIFCGCVVLTNFSEWFKLLLKVQVSVIPTTACEYLMFCDYIYAVDLQTSLAILIVLTLCKNA